jgi:hypothetical protein
LLAAIALLGLAGLPAIHELRHDARTHVHDGDVVRFEDAAGAAHAGGQDRLHHASDADAAHDDDRELPEGGSGLDHPEPWHPRHGAHSALHGHLALLAAPPPAALEPVEPLWHRPPRPYAAPLAVQRFRIPVVAQGPPAA